MKKNSVFIGFLGLALLLQACGEVDIPEPDPQPLDAFDIVISRSPYTALRNVGGSAVVQEKRVLVARIKDGTWEAVSSYCPSDNSSPITFDPSNDTFRCAKDNSTYDKDGKVLSGGGSPLINYLVTYQVNNSNNDEVLTIYKVSQ